MDASQAVNKKRKCSEIDCDNEAHVPPLKRPKLGQESQDLAVLTAIAPNAGALDLTASEEKKEIESPPDNGPADSNDNASSAKSDLQKSQPNSDYDSDSADSDSDDAHTTTEHLQASIKPIVKDILQCGAGDVSVGGPASDWLPSIPGLFVNHGSIGHVPLPISECGALLFFRTEIQSLLLSDTKNLVQLSELLVQDVLQCFVDNVIHFNSLTPAATVELLKYFVVHCDVDQGNNKADVLKRFETIYLQNVEQPKQQKIAHILMGKERHNLVLKENAIVHNLLFARLQHLTATAPKEPVFTWKMDISAGNQMDADFIEFLRSDREQFRKTGFTGIANARKWAAKIERKLYDQRRRPYSVDCTATGTGRNASVLCVKTKHVFDRTCMDFQRSSIQREICNLNRYIGVSTFNRQLNAKDLRMNY